MTVGESVEEDALRSAAKTDVEKNHTLGAYTCRCCLLNCIVCRCRIWCIKNSDMHIVQRMATVRLRDPNARQQNQLKKISHVFCGLHFMHGGAWVEPWQSGREEERGDSLMRSLTANLRSIKPFTSIFTLSHLFCIRNGYETNCVGPKKRRKEETPKTISMVIIIRTVNEIENKRQKESRLGRENVYESFARVLNINGWMDAWE